MKTIGVDGAGMALNLSPLSSFILAVIVLGEAVTPMRIAAITMVIISMMFFMKFSQLVMQDKQIFASTN